MANSATPASTTTERVTPKTVQQAVSALLKWRDSKNQGEKPKLFDQDDEFMYLILSLKKIPPKARVNPYKILLPHSLLSEFSELCLIIDDRPKSNLTKDEAQKKIKSENMPVSKVLKLSKLKSDYRPFEAKRKLCDSYHMFFADRRVIPLLPRLIGKHFFQKKKIPVPLDLKHKNWKEQIEKACSSALLFFSTGTCSLVRVAKVGMGKQEIVENVVAAINGIVEVVPKKWANVRSFHLKLLESLALPIYEAVPDMKLKIEGAKDKEVELEEERKNIGKVDGMKDQKVSKKKGRIHEVRYMDDTFGGELSDDEAGSEDGAGMVEGDSENHDLRSVDKKRKKGNKRIDGALSESNSSKRVKKSAKDKNNEGIKQKEAGFSTKGMKENIIKQKKNKSPAEDGEPGKKKKKRKIGVVKSEGQDMKINAKKGKKAA